MHLIEMAKGYFFPFPGRKKVLKLFLFMKLTVVLLLAATLGVSANGFTQRVDLRLRNATLKQTFREIQRQTGFNFLYTKQMVENTPLVNVNLANASLQDALAECLKKQQLDYFIENTTVILRRKLNLSPPSTSNTIMPDTLPPLKGLVMSENNSPLQGATIRIISLNLLTNSNAQGAFVLPNVPKGRYRVEISYVGFDDYIVTVDVNSNTSNIVASLKQALSRLDEVQVVAYGTSTKRFFTGNQTSVKSQDIEKQPVANALAALQGRMAGVLVTSANGIPGSGITMQIRGNYSLSAQANPLYIIDGIPFTPTTISTVNTASGSVSPFNSINPSDIESISILKDADASAIYGSRGANGVVLITTKKGKPGKTKFDVNAYSGSSVATRIPDFLNTTQYLDVRKRAFAADGITPTTTNAQDLLLWSPDRYTNFPEMILGNTAPFTNLQASVSGGNENTRLLMSVGYHNEGSVIFGNNYDKRVAGHLNIDHYSSDKKFNINTSISYTNDNIKTLASDPYLAIYAPPNFPQYDSTGALYWIARDGQANTANPWSYLNKVGRTWTDNFMANTSLKYNITAGLNAKVNVGYTKMFMTQQVTAPTTAYNPTSTSSTKSSATFGNSSIQTYIVEPQVDYTKTFGNATINVLAGGTAQTSNGKTNTITGINFSSDDLIESISAANTITSRNNTTSQYKYISGFGRFNFRWMDKYIVNATFRRDGSSRFGPDKRFGNFWSIAGAWIFSEENIIKENLGVLSFGKFRASYGITGNDGIQDYNYYSLYTSNSQAYNGNQGLYAYQVGNPVYSWEQNNKLEVAAELGFIKNRILLTASWYRNRSDNQLVWYSLPSQTGFTGTQQNLNALLQTTSTEFELTSINIRHKDFNWQTNFNITFPGSKLIKFPNLESSAYANTYVIGQPVKLFMGYHYTGLSATGVPEFLDNSKDGNITSADYINLGTTIPKFYGGLGNTISWKGFSLDIFLHFVKQMGYNAYKAFYFPPGYKVNVPTAFVKDNRDANTNPNGTQPVLSTTLSNPAGSGYAYVYRFYYSDYAFSDASFIRLKNLSLAYTLPGSWTDKLHVQNLRVYVQGQNLFTKTKYQGLDPEVQNATPVLKTLTAGFQLTF